MLSKEIIIERLKASYPYLGAEYGVKRIGLFGSFAQDCANEASDIIDRLRNRGPIKQSAHA